MYEHKEMFSIARMAKVLNVSESGYYKWQLKKEGVLSEKELADHALTTEIREIFMQSRGSYGCRKVTKVLNSNKKEPINHKRVERLMNENGLFSRTCKKYINTTDSKHAESIADNLIDRKFDASSPNEKMVSDTTVVSTKQGNIYVAGILDLYGRMPVGLAMSRHNDKHLVIEAFKDMLYRGCGTAGCILHSDRGSTYASADYRKLISNHEMICSMSKKGDCWDNAPMESFWGKMKSEWLADKYDTIEAAKRDIYEYVWRFYPKERPHASNGYMTPAQYYEQSRI